MAEQCFSGTQYTGNGVRFRFDYLPCSGRQIFRCASINFAVKVFYDFGTAFEDYLIPTIRERYRS